MLLLGIVGGMRRGGTRQRVALDRKPLSPAQWRGYGDADPQPYCRQLRIANRAHCVRPSAGRAKRMCTRCFSFCLRNEGRSEADGLSGARGGGRGNEERIPRCCAPTPSFGRGEMSSPFGTKGGAKQTRAQRDEGGGFGVRVPLPIDGRQLMP